MLNKQPILKFRDVADLVYAKVTKDTASEYVTGEVKHLAWVAELSSEVETNTTTEYFDNQAAFVYDSEGAQTINITGAALTDEVLADITGKEYDSDKEAFYDTERELTYFALGYRYGMKGDKNVEKFQWLYKGSFGIPNMTVKTNDDSSDTNGQELTYTAISPIHKFTAPSGNQKSMKGFRVTNTGSDKCKEFFDSVMTPDEFNSTDTTV